MASRHFGSISRRKPSGGRTLAELGAAIGELVDRKRASYTPHGVLQDTVYSIGSFLRILYPAGIPPDQYERAALLVRMFDKIVRVVNYGIKDGFDENPAMDIVGYALRLYEILEGGSPCATE